jgi:hypothetical protein
MFLFNASSRNKENNKNENEKKKFLETIALFYLFSNHK